MLNYQEKVKKHTKRQKTQFEDTEQTSEPDSDMTRMLDFKTGNSK